MTVRHRAAAHTKPEKITASAPHTVQSPPSVADVVDVIIAIKSYQMKASSGTTSDCQRKRTSLSKPVDIRQMPMPARTFSADGRRQGAAAHGNDNMPTTRTDARKSRPVSSNAPTSAHKIGMVAPARHVVDSAHDAGKYALAMLHAWSSGRRAASAQIATICAMKDAVRQRHVAR